MKALRPTLGLFFLSMLVFSNSMAQKVSYTSPGGLTIGFGGGAAYQKSDLVNSKGFGFDFILGSKIYHKENAFLSVDWKFRFLAGQNKAYDHRINADNTYSNIRYSFFNYDLELGLTLNRLRERTRIVLTGFAGAGLTHGRTFTDIYDAGNNLYDYGGIDPNRDSKSIYNDLVALSDGDFETHLVSKVAILPTAGLYLGYQFSRSLTVGIEYKTNFYLTEDNSLVGIDLDNRVYSGSRIDRNNYVSLGFRWKLRGGPSNHRATNNYSGGETSTYANTTNTGNLVVPVSLSHPMVNITNPSAESTHTGSPNHTIKATIKNVDGPDNISFYQNGFPNNSFTYNANTQAFIASVRLRVGENSFRIKATKQQASAEDQAVIILDDPMEAIKLAPSVEFTSPAGYQITSSSNRIDVTASVENISSKEDIQLTLEGSHAPFEYYPVSGLVKTSVMLAEGNNNLLIKASNETGSAQDQLSINYNISEELALPMVRFINPATPVEVINNRFPLSAEIQNVNKRNDVTVSVNGASIYNFFFDAKGSVSVSLFLPEGISTIEITARNEAGFASDATSITYYKPVNNEPVYQQPVYQQPAYQQPVYQQPVYQQPVNQQPVNQQPVNQQPVYQRPVNQQPVSHEPVNRISPPVINIVSPVTNPFRTNEPSEELRATVLNVNSKDNITLNVNGSNSRNFNFNYRTKLLTASVALRDGENLLTVGAQNESGRDAKELLFMKETRPCRQPVIRLIDPVQGQSSTDQQIYALRAEVRNAHSSQLRLTANGKPLSFNLDNNLLSTSVPLTSGLNTLSLSASNECGEDQIAASISYVPPVVIDPCNAPRVSFTLQEVNRNDATHELRGSVSGVKNKADISLTLDGRAHNGFQFAPATGDLNARFKLAPGSHTVVVSVKNECGTDAKSESVSLEEEACGIRINPGNADWQFCLVTHSGTFTRDNLTNENFSYSGPARSLYFLPIGGGGNATVNGRPYSVRSGQYYLFSGNVNVDISTKNPGSMGHWSVCITAGSAPISGNGNNRPKSPCESENDDKPKAKDNDPPKAKDDDPPKSNDDVTPKAKDDDPPKANDDVTPRGRDDVTPRGRNDVTPRGRENDGSNGNKVRR
jgi:hypothetical protein